jgi:hypothetical protein
VELELLVLVLALALALVRELLPMQEPPLWVLPHLMWVLLPLLLRVLPLPLLLRVLPLPLLLRVLPLPLLLRVLLPPLLRVGVYLGWIPFLLVAVFSIVCCFVVVVFCLGQNKILPLDKLPLWGP